MASSYTEQFNIITKAGHELPVAFHIETGEVLLWDSVGEKWRAPNKYSESYSAQDITIGNQTFRIEENGWAHVTPSKMSKLKHPSDPTGDSDADLFADLNFGNTDFSVFKLNALQTPSKLKHLKHLCNLTADSDADLFADLNLVNEDSSVFDLNAVQSTEFSHLHPTSQPNILHQPTDVQGDAEAKVKAEKAALIAELQELRLVHEEYREAIKMVKEMKAFMDKMVKEMKAFTDKMGEPLSGHRSAAARTTNSTGHSVPKSPKGPIYSLQPAMAATPKRKPITHKELKMLAECNCDTCMRPLSNEDRRIVHNLFLKFGVPESFWHDYDGVEPRCGFESSAVASQAATTKSRKAKEVSSAMKLGKTSSAPNHEEVSSELEPKASSALAPDEAPTNFAKEPAEKPVKIKQESL